VVPFGVGQAIQQHAAAMSREAEEWSRSERAPEVIMSPRLVRDGVLVNRAQ